MATPRFRSVYLSHGKGEMPRTWFCFNSSFLSVVADKDNPGNLMAKAWRKADPVNGCPIPGDVGLKGQNNSLPIRRR